MTLRQFIITCIFLLATGAGASAQINTDQVMRIGRNTLYFEDYVLSIQYFNQVINAKPHLAQPYFYRAIAKLNLEDYTGAEADASLAIERNPFITDAYEVRAVARQNLGKLREAVDDYDAALADMPINRGVLYNKALALTEMKDFHRADSTFEVLIDAFPGFDSAFLGRARMRLMAADTVAAAADIEHALSLNRNAVNGYLMRADIAMHSTHDYKAALADMNEAIKLQPRYAGFFINRAFLRYMTDDYFGAMADYDYALQLEPDNAVALFNRAMLRAEVHDTNRAIEDFSRVLAIDPMEYKAMYNRAMLLADIGDFDSAIRDLDTVIAAYPDFAAAYFMRYDVKRRKGDLIAAKGDYDRSIALAGSSSMTPTIADDPETESKAETQEEVKRRFESLATVDDNSEPDEVYSNANIRGKVQDRNLAIELEPMFALTYYTSPTELKQSGDYIKEADEVNATRALRFILQVTNHIPSMTDEDVIRSHFASIDYYTSYLSTHSPRPIDYFGRAMDYITTRNYARAIEDLDSAISLAPDFTVAYLMRADARYHDIDTSDPDTPAPRDISSDARASLASHETRDRYRLVLDDLDRVAKLSPEMAIAQYNKGVVYARLQDYTSAISAFTRAIELKPDFGEAYYNRGYVYLNLGNRTAGTADLSKAGELGIVPSYNLLKRMNR